MNISKLKLMCCVGLVMCGVTAHAGSTDLTGLKVPCATFKAGKLIQKTTCTVTDGIASGNVWRSGMDVVLKLAKSRQSIRLTHLIVNQVHADGSVVYDDEDNLVIAKVESTLNDAPATTHHRHVRTLKVIADNPEMEYYQCFVAPQGEGFDEFCVLSELGF